MPKQSSTSTPSLKEQHITVKIQQITDLQVFAHGASPFGFCKAFYFTIVDYTRYPPQSQAFLTNKCTVFLHFFTIEKPRSFTVRFALPHRRIYKKNGMHSPRSIAINTFHFWLGRRGSNSRVRESKSRSNH